MKHYRTPGPEWCRRQWVSAEARALWAPRIQAITADWNAVECATVGACRQAAVLHVDPGQLAAFSAKVAERRLVLNVMAQVGAGPSYTSGTVAPDGGAFQYKVSIATSKDVSAQLASAWDDKVQTTVAELLGYPQCCADFFAATWDEAEWHDTTWPMADGHQGGDPHLATADVNPNTNVLLRWAGVRWFPHLPCSFECEHTAQVANDFRAHTPQHIIDWKDELLGAPIEWSSRNGIALIRHPLFTISASTDVVPGATLRVQLHGGAQPAGAPTGLAFPLHFLGGPPATDTWTPNGFGNEVAMRAAHDVVLQAVAAAALALGEVATVVDYGCGDGTLLARVPCANRQGFELNANAAAAARLNGVEVLGGDMALDHNATLPQCDVALLMPGRLLEMGDKAQPWAAELRRTARTLVVYAYGDWLEQHGSLEGLATKALGQGRLLGAVTGTNVSGGIWAW